MRALARVLLMATALSLPFAAQAAVRAPASIPWAQLAADYHPAPDTDEGGLWMIGDRAEKQIRMSPLLVKDPALNAYLHKIVCRLAGPYCSSIRIYVLDIPYFEAAMSPNGMLQVWTGFLLRARNEAQVSFVLGHEISHYLLRDTISQYRRLRDQAGAVAVLGALTGGLGNLAGLGLRSSVNAFSRDEEREADARGFELATAAGYDPAQSVELWREELDEEIAAPKDKEFEVFAASHPPTAERVATLSAMAKAKSSERAHWEVGSDSYESVLRLFRMQWLSENLALFQFDQSLALVQALLRDEPRSGELQYALGEIYRRRNADGDSAKALAAYCAAIAAGDAPKDVYRGLGLTSMKAGDKAAARTALQKYLAIAPSSDDRAMIEFYLSQL
jgi:predicted Zn-dependent protease